MRYYMVWLASVAISLSLNACGGKQQRSKTDSRTVSGDTGESTSARAAEALLEGVRMRLFEAPFETRDDERPEVAVAAPLSAKETRALLKRVDDLALDDGDEKTFAFRKGSSPPPKTGETVNAPFPSERDVPPPSAGEPGTLAVVRYAPEGNVPMAPHLSITFSKPMVAISSQNAAANQVPAVLSPTPKGVWRWLGTQTLLFDPEERFPAATDYRIRIPAGTRSASGDRLARAFAFSFSTPPLEIERSFPATDAPQGLTPTIVMAFNQRIDPATLLPFVALSAGDAVYPVRIVEIDAATFEDPKDAEIHRLITQYDRGHILAVTPIAPLPKATLFDVVIKKGAPSAEGPKKTRKQSSFSFRTYAPLTVEKRQCGWRDQCHPTDPWIIEMSNPLDLDDFDAARISISPAAEGMEIHAWRRTIQLRGMMSGNTTYTVTLPADLKDEFGQTLGEATDVTFEVGPAEKALFGPPQDLITLDPFGPRGVAVHTVNHDSLRVEIHATAPRDLRTLQSRQTASRAKDPSVSLPGKSVFKGVVDIESKQDALTKTLIDLAPYLENGFGQFLVRIVPTEPKNPKYPEQLLVWVQATRLGVTAFSDNDEMVVWTTNLEDGRPVAGAAVSLLGEKEETVSKSDESGLARFDMTKIEDAPHTIVVKNGPDTAILPHDANLRWGGGRWRRIPQTEEARWFVFDDRGMYRPGETAQVKGWLRGFDPKKNGDISALDPLPKQIEWSLKDSRQNEILSGEASVSRLGGFYLSLDLPDEMNLGSASLTLKATPAKRVSRSTWQHAILVEEFRRPEFEVSVSGDPGPYVLGDEALVTMSAKYYSGGALPFAPVTWRVHATPARFRPPGHDDYHFGPWDPWWSFFREPPGPVSHETLSGETDATGVHRLGIRFEAMATPRPMRIQVVGQATDINRQTWTGTHEVTLHPSRRYVGLKPDHNFVGRNEPVTIDVMVVDLDGHPVTDRPVDVTFSKLVSVQKKGKWEEEAQDKGQCRVERGALPGRCIFTPDTGGVYRVRASVKEGGNLNQTDIQVWVAGAELPSADSVTEQRVTLIPEKETYQPGETATFMVQSPFYPAEGVMTVRRSGIVKTERFRMEGPTHVLSLAIEEGYIPNIQVQVNLVGAAKRAGTDQRSGPLPKRPAFATGALTFQVPPFARTLEVAIAPEEKVLAPGGRTAMNVTVTDAAGAPVKGAELAVVVADESVLALSGYRLPDPIELFYAARTPGVQDYHLRHQVVLAAPEEVTGRAQSAVTGGTPIRDSMPGEGAGKRPAPSAPIMAQAADSAIATKAMALGERHSNRGGGEQIATRGRFDALALFAPEVVTDKRGRARIKLALPDSLTRYRIMAVAVAKEKQFGKGSSEITARLPLMVRPSAPRFLNYGDRFTLPVLIENQTDEAMSVKVAVRAGNIRLVERLDAPSSETAPERVTVSGRRVTVPPRNRVAVQFPGATMRAGTARFQVAVASGAFADAQSFDLPVWTPATAEAFATYGVVDDGIVVQPVARPDEIIPAFGGLEISTQSTELQALTDAMLYLVDYPHECTEQIASKILAIAALKDVLTAFEVEEMPSPKALEKSVGDGIRKLEAIQNPDGGFGFWQRGERTWPYLTVHAAHALAVAKQKGFDISKRMWDKVVQYLMNIDRLIPGWYSPESRQAIVAYSIYVLDKMKVKVRDRAPRLLESAGGVEKLPMEALGWLWPVLKKTGGAAASKSIRRRVMNSVTETAAGAHFVTAYDDGAHVLLHSDRRVDGVLLDALISVSPSSDLIPKLVRGLLGHRVKGRWSSTQENAFVLLALDRYFQQFEKATPNFVAKVWLGEKLAIDHRFKGHTTNRVGADIPMQYMTGSAPQPVTIDKSGVGRLYYRIGMRYAPKSLTLAPADYGFSLERRYEAIDDPKDVRRDSDGTWRIKAGARVRVQLTMATPMRRYHVALIDPLPAGFEAINPDLAVTGGLPENPGASRQPYWWWYRPWFEHQNMRDERVEAFTSLLWDGVHEYTYVVRATIPGRFVAPPTRAEEMYHPETFGRTGTDKVVVE